MVGAFSQYILSAGIKNQNNFKLDSIDLPRFNLTNSRILSDCSLANQIKITGHYILELTDRN